MEILKLATQTGNRALVIKADWNGMLKVEMITGDQVGATKSYKPEDVAVVVEESKTSRLRRKRTSLPLALDRSGAMVEEPGHLLCPITSVMFRDPVVLESGHTYERSALEEHLRLRATDPLTNTALPHATGKETLGLPNLLVRRQVQKFLDQHPGYTPDGWDARTLPKATVLRIEATPELSAPPE